jgi:hypothetical protein
MFARIALFGGLVGLLIGAAVPAGAALMDDVAVVNSESWVYVRDGNLLLPVLTHNDFGPLTTVAAAANDDLVISGDLGVVWRRSANDLYSDVVPSGGGFGPIVDAAVHSTGNIALNSTDNLFLRDPSLGYIETATGFAFSLGPMALQSNDDTVVLWNYAGVGGDIHIYRPNPGAGAWDNVTNRGGLGMSTAIAIQSNDNIVTGNASGQVFLYDSAIASLAQNDNLDGRVTALARLADDTIIAGTFNETTVTGTLYALRGSDVVTLGSSTGYGNISAIAVQSDNEIIVGNQEGDLRRIRIDFSGGTPSFSTEASGGGFGTIRDIAILHGNANEQVIYRETFPNLLGGTNSKGLSEEGWQAHGGNAAVQVGGASGTDPVTISYSDGGAARAGVNSNPSTGATIFGYTYHYGATPNEPQLLWTDEYTIGSGVDLIAAEWQQYNTGAKTETGDDTDVIPGLAVQVGGNWYVTNELGTFVAQTPRNALRWFDVVRMDMDSATWSLLNFVPSLDLSVGGLVGTLPDGAITAFGLYVPSFPEGDVSLRFDNFTWIAAPTPPLLGDANGDNVVDDKDASVLGANWRRQGDATWADGDFNGDHNVDDKDAAILAAHWGATGEEGSVPEPSTATLLVIGVVAVLGLTRRRRSG